MNSTTFFIIFILVLSCLAKVYAFNFSHQTVFNFGDSNSDTGGLAASLALPLEPPNGQTFFQKPTGRFCDGRLILDFLMDAMGLPFSSPYLESVGAPNFRSGCNFAIGGSTILPVEAHAISPFNFGVQVAQFIRFKARALELLSNDRNMQRFLPSEDSFRQGIYMFDTGQNDIDGAFSLMSNHDQVFATIPTLLTEFQTGIKALYNEGARNFWIHNTGPLGCLPRIIATFGKNASLFDKLNCVDSHNRAARLFNLQLHAKCADFRAQFPEAKFTYVDIYSIKSNLIANYSKHGFKEALAACCGYGGLPLNFDVRIVCGETKTLNGTVVTGGACNNSSEYVNWDGTHYTEAANQYVASQILSGKYLDPPLHARNSFTPD